MSVEVLIAKMDGKLDMISSSQSRQEVDIREIRLRQETQADQLTKLNSLNIQDRLTSLSGRLDSVETEQTLNKGERKGVENVVRVVYATCSLLGVSAVIVAAKLLFVPISGG